MLNSNVVNLFGNRPFNTPVVQTTNIVAPIQHQQIERVINPDIEETIKAECKYKDFTTFNIIEESIYTVSAEDRINQIPKKKALFVEDKCINIVGDKYKIVQPNDVIQAFQNSTGLTVDKILTNKNTGGLLLKSTLANPYLNGDEHKIDLTFYTGHNGQYRTFLSLQALRIACMNQLPAMNANKSLWLMNEKHYQSFSFDKLQKIIETLPLHMANFTNDYSKLIDIKITKKEFLELFVGLVFSFAFWICWFFVAEVYSFLPSAFITYWSPYKLKSTGAYVSCHPV